MAEIALIFCQMKSATLLLFILFLFPQRTPAHTLKVLTYNVWMVDAPFKLGSLDIEPRAAAIPGFVAALNPDIVLLQEVWPDSQKLNLLSGFKKNGYPFSFYEDIPASILMRGLVGNGLLVISRYPIEPINDPSHRVLAFSDFTRPDEYFARKGALHVKVSVPELGSVDIYNTHLGAVSFIPEKRQFNQAYNSSRKNQMAELVQFIRKTRSTVPLILAGDINTHFKTYNGSEFTTDYVSDYSWLTCLGARTADCLDLNNTFNSVHGEKHSAATSDHKTNAYGATSPVYTGHGPAQMLDYIYVSKSPRLEIAGSEVVFTSPLNIPEREKTLPLSDHFGVLTTFTLR